DPSELSPIAMLPTIDVSPYADLSPDRQNIVERLATIYRLSHPELHPRIVITSAEALARRTVAPAELAARSTIIAKGDTLDRDAFSALLVAGGWTRVPVVDEPGTFAVRGGVIDIFSPLTTHPVRVELFGDEVETLRTFDAESQRTLRPVERVYVHPVRETIPTTAVGVRARLRDYADTIDHPSKATRKLIEQLEAGEVFVGIEGLTPAFHDEMVAPGALFPDTARWLVVDPDACRRAITDLWVDAEARFARRREARDLVFPPDAHLVTAAEAGPFTARRRIELPTLEVLDEATDLVRLRVDIDNLRTLRQELDHARTFSGEADHASPLVTAIRRWLAEGLAVTIGCDSQNRFDRLQGVLAARKLAGVELVHGTPTASFASPKDRVAIVTSADVFGVRTHHTSARQKRARDALLGGVADFGQLAAGDFLVHQRHGVGKYLGLEKLAIASQPAPSDGPYAPTARAPYQIDALKLEYDGGTLYLPVYRLGEVQRYVGAEGHAPRLDKLGGLTWEVTRTKVERHVQVLAEELLQIYAQRAAIPGHPFPPADDAFREFEATFPFDETPDQQAAIDAVLGDMESPRAMDRLVCGDVGYGKTEVALRAVFRCVQGGLQAAVLAPTTVLVEQHFRTMTERFRGTGVNLAKLSRFQSKAEQIATVKKITEGGVDVVIGTHRLLSADVRWKALGLLVIDEEQRFGVAHKEKIKKT
ncbi:MAG: DEAD/DEAH box helicase, partial [Proteobacteria bacterium]|nr:DEAD/DEAH box helicase [Pseudomonadota bacterium]